MVHSFVCNKHLRDIVVEDTNCKGVHKCPECGKDMYWDLGGNVSGRGDYEHISDSLAIHPDDTNEHHKLFPSVGLTKEGQPIFTSVRQQERYAERCGFHKKRQRLRNLGRKRIV